MFKTKPVLMKYIATACIIILILATGFAINNVILLRSLEHSYRERTLYLVDNGFQYIEQRWQLYTISAIAIQADREGGIQRLFQHRHPIDRQFYTGANMLMTNLRTFQFTNPEIVDIVIWYDRMDVFFNSNGTWSKALLPHWEQFGHFPNIDFSWIQREERSAIFTMNNHVVYYSNYHQHTHMFIVIYPPALSASLAQLIPERYGRFEVSMAGMPLNISNGGALTSETPDIIIQGSGLLAYHFYYNPSAYSFMIGTMTITSTALATGITLLAAILLLRIKKDLYDPVPHIMDQLKINKGEKNEFTQIMDAIDLMHTNLDHLSFSHAISEEDSEKIKSLVDHGSKNFCALTILFEDEYGYKDSDRIRVFSKEISVFKYYPVHVISKYSFYFFFVSDVGEYEALISRLASHLRESDGFAQCGISSLYNDLSLLNIAMDESLKAFHDVPTDGFIVEKKPQLYNETGKKGRISTSNHNQLIANAIQSDMESITTTMMDILQENADTSSTVKRRLMFYMYDTICMLTGLSNKGVENPKRLFLQDIYDPQLLFNMLCEDLSGQLQTVGDTDSILGWIDENLHRDISLSDLADAMNMSYSYVSVYFKTKVGMNFLEFLQKKRIEGSMALLANSDKGIDEIAISTGFVSTNTFFRVFKKYAGVTPSKYRETAKPGVITSL